MSVRSLIRKAAKPLAMTAVAGGLAMSLVVTTPSNAQAFVAPVLPVIAGAAEVATGVAAITPVGWVILGGVGLAAGLYYSKDYWLPYVTGLFGSAANNQTTAPAGSWSRAQITERPGLSPDKKTLTVKYFAPAFGQDWQSNFGVLAHCKDPVSGATGYKSSQGYSYINANNAYNYTFNASPCPIGYEIIGWIAGGGQGSSLGQYRPNLNTSDPQPVQMDGESSQYMHSTKDVWRGLDMGQQEFDPKSPDMKYRVEAECISNDGVKSFANGYSNGSMAGVVFPSCAAQGKGHGAGNIKIFYTPPGTTIENPTPIWTATPKAPDPSTPLCDSTRAGSGCKLAVQLDGKPCVMGLFACENWTDLSKNPDWTPRFSCQYGPYSVPLSTCNPLERAYEPGGVPATEKNTDGDPQTKDDNQPDGQPTPKNDTPTTTEPGGAGKPNPVPGPAGSPTAAAADCWPSGWSAFNPLEWVLKPLGCAFIPRMDVQAKAKALSDVVSTKAPVSWIVKPPAILGPSGGGCPSWVVKVGSSFSQNAVCDSSFTAAIRSIRAPLFGIVSAAMVWPLVRSIWYAAIPVLRVAPSSGGK